VGEGEPAVVVACEHPTRPSRQEESAEVLVVLAACATIGAEGQAMTSASGKTASAIFDLELRRRHGQRRNGPPDPPVR